MNKYDLRTALNMLVKDSQQLAYIDEEVDPFAEISGIYRIIGAGGTVERPTKEGPAIIFNNIKGFDNHKVLIGLLASRNRVAKLLNCNQYEISQKLIQGYNNRKEPIVLDKNIKSPAQEIVHLATDEGFDIRKLIPAPTNTEFDAGPYITLGLCYARNPITKEGDITIHRLCLQSKDEMTMFFTPGIRHLDAFRKKAEESGSNLPISISIGVDPAIEIATCFEPPTTPEGFNELSIAGGLRGEPIELIPCITIDECAIANAEIIIEGELIANKRMDEDFNSKTGFAMPEFTGYTGSAAKNLPVIKVKAVTHRKNPITQTCIGASEEHVSMAGLPTEASILQLEQQSLGQRVKNVYAHSSGGGKYMVIIQFCKFEASDEGRQRQAALIAFTAFPELKHVILVDEDVDIFDTNDVLWALNTRYQGDIDTINIPGVRCHPLDPSQDPNYSPYIKDVGISCKTIFDCTVPYNLKNRFSRSKFMDVNMNDYQIKNYKVNKKF